MEQHEQSIMAFLRVNAVGLDQPAAAQKHRACFYVFALCNSLGNKVKAYKDDSCTLESKDMIDFLLCPSI